MPDVLPNEEVENTIEWTLTAQGIYTGAYAWEGIRQKGTIVPWPSVVWSKSTSVYPNLPPSCG